MVSWIEPWKRSMKLDKYSLSAILIGACVFFPVTWVMLYVVIPELFPDLYGSLLTLLFAVPGLVLAYIVEKLYYDYLESKGKLKPL